MHDLRVHARATPDRIAIVCDRADGSPDADVERLTYAELESLANRIAHVFRDLGLTRGDHVAMLIGNRTEALAIAWAAWRSGIYLTPLATALTATELHYLIEDATATLVICDAQLGSVAATLPARISAPRHWLSVRGGIPGHVPLEPLLAGAAATPPAEEPPGALMMYTSGTTGAPKGVIRPLLPADWRGTPPFAADLIALFDLAGEQVRYLSTAPLYHAAPLRFALAVTAGGGTVHVMTRFAADDALRRLQTHRITHSQWVPAMFQRLLALPPSRRENFRAPAHRVAIHGAAPCSPAVKSAMIDWWGPILLEYYSGTEGVGLTLIDSSEALRKPGSVGRVRKGTLHVVGDNGLEMPSGDTGLICFSGVAPFAYFNAPEKTAGRTTPQGWQTFGDVGHVDADGYLYLTDRQDDMIICGGVNLYPQEIEAVILQVTGVADCAVVGVPDDRFGEIAIAWVVASALARDEQSLVVAAVDRHCKQYLGRFKQPAEIRLIEELPRSPTGKLLRRRLRDAI